MKNKLVIVLYLFASFYLFSYDRLIKWDKEELTDDRIAFNDNQFLFNNGLKVEENQTSYIIFNAAEETAINKDEGLLDINTSDLLKRAEYMSQKYPDSSLLVLYDEGIQKLNQNGTRYTHSRMSLKIMNEKYLSLAVISLYYVKNKHESKIIMARSISPQGVISSIKDSDITYSAPKQDLAFFSGRKDDKIILVTIPNVKVGSIIDFEYETVEGAPEDPEQFYTQWYFAGDDPVFESRVKFIVPENKKFYWVCKNMKDENRTPQTETKEGYRIFTFHEGEAAPFVPEPNSPPHGELMPSVFGSVFKDQTYLSAWLAKFMKERMVSNEKMKATVTELINKTANKSEEEITAILYRFVQENIQYRSIKTSLSSGFSGHPAPETFDNRYGDCIDKSILFSTLLGLADIEAYPVILSTNDEARPLYNEIGVITGNHSITEIHLKEKGKKIIFLDSTHTTFKYPAFRSDDQGVPAWNPILNTVREIEPINPDGNTIYYNKTIQLTPEGNGTVSTHNIYNGETEAGLRQYFQAAKDQEIYAALSSVISRDYPGSKLVKYKYGDPVNYQENLYLDLIYEARAVAKITGNYLIMNIPVYYDLDYLALQDRKYPLFFQTTEGSQHQINIQVPVGYTVKGLPESLIINSKHFTYSGSYQIIDNKIIFTDHFARKSVRIPADDYPEFRRQLLQVDHFIKIPLLIEKKSSE